MRTDRETGMKMKALCAFGIMALAGCASVPKAAPTAQPFAILYGDRKAQWLSSNQKSIFCGKNDPVSFHETEIKGFQNLDVSNQKLYLVVRFCTHQTSNAEDGSQMRRLISALKCPKRELSQYIASLDRKSLKWYASSLDGSIDQFDTNVRIYLP